MVKNDIRPYELSLWTLQDSFITVLKPIGISNRGQVETPKCLIKNDGTQELSFSIPMYYRENGILIENPIWHNVQNGSLIVNLRKLKLIFNKGEEGEEIVEFVINNVVETHTDGQLKCEVTAEGLAFQELGKVGYKISLLSQDFIDEYTDWYQKTVGVDTDEETFDYPTEEAKKEDEPINNLNYWCDKIFTNSRWNYSIQMNWSSYDGIITEMSNEERDAANPPLRRTDKIYEEEYISSWEYIDGILAPSNMENFKEKLRLVDLEKSNIYNLTQDLAQAFGVYCKYKYSYDENYHIIGKECIFYNNFLAEKDGKIDIIYPYSTSKIEREIDSADIVTKMFVTPVEDETSASGLITIADVEANKMREDYILNFDYLYNIGTISQEQYDAIADYERSMYLINIELEPLAMQRINLENDLITYKAQLTLSKDSQILDKEQMEQSTALLDAITKGTGTLYKNLDTPYRGTLLNSANNDGTYYIKISQEGVDLTGQIGYPLHAGEDNIYGIRLYYYAEVPGATEGSIEKVLMPYVEGEPSNPNVAIFPEDIKIEKDEFGNITSLSNISLRENTVSKNYFVTFAYKPELYYQNIYDTYAKKLAADEASEKEAIAKIAEIEEKLEKIENRYSSLLNQKQELIIDFENMMGPALKEGTWQADTYNDYGSKYTGQITIDSSTTEHINFYWDTIPFEEEQLLYYEEGINQSKVFYPCIDLSNYLNEVKDNLKDLSFIYKSITSEIEIDEETTFSDWEQMTIGSEMQFAFIRSDSGAKPVLLLTDKSFELTDKIKTTAFLGTITSSITEDGVSINIIKKVENLTWIENDENSIMIYPRLKVDSLLLKTSEDELIIKIDEEILRNYYDYSILIREENYFITLKNEVMLQDGNLNKTFDIAYSLSNAALSLYLDALEISKTNAFPQVSYTLEVSAMNKSFIKYAYNSLNRIVSINDTELKFEDVQGYISELDLDLDNPWEDKITIQNYKTKFEDLFSTIVASSEQMKTNSFAYNNAASAFSSNGILKSSVIQNTINQADLTYAFQSGSLTIDEINGIWARSDAGVVAIRGGGIFCATQTDNNGNWLWNTGIMPSGINASLLTAGQIDTNLIKIYAGDNLRLQLNADGLFAYNKDSTGEANLNQYVVHNSDGLFSTIVNENGTKTNLVEVSWNGFILRDEQGNIVFNANKEGDLTIVGTIEAADGLIGGWTIEDTGLWYENGKAGLTVGSGEIYGEDSIHALKGHEKMLWVTGTTNTDGTVNEFVVTTDGTLYCSDAIVRGTISAGSFIGNTEAGEVDQQLRAISITILDGTTFSFENRNYDGNLIVSPEQLKFRISTNALTPLELSAWGIEDENGNIPSSAALEGYHFYYGVSDTDEENATWKELEFKEDNSTTGLIWEPNYLTFRIESDIMYLRLDETLEKPQTKLYFKVEKEGRLREVISLGEISYRGNIITNEDGTISENPYLYKDSIQLVSETYGLEKYVSPINPPSYTFVEDKNLDIDYEDLPTVVFSTVLTGFTMEEASKGYWLVNGGEEIITYSLFGSNTETKAISSNGSVIVSDEEEIIISDEIIEERDYIGLADDIDNIDTDGINVFLTPQEDGTILASAVVSYKKIPDGGNIKLTFKIDYATRDSFCFKTRNGSDGINVIMRSSSGSTLTNGDTETELSIEIYYGTQLMNSNNSETQFYYVWKKDKTALSSISKVIVNEEEDSITSEITTISTIENILANPDKTNIVNIDFFKQSKIYITAADFGVKSDYRCDVFTSLQEAIDEYELMNENEDEELIIPE